ncbi:MAG: lipid kinase YegS [Thermodesulfobacteriota bacterium]
MLRIILNGKKAGLDSVRAAITTLRREVAGVEVRVTYEYGDVERLVSEAVADGGKRLVIGGGDGSVNEAVDALAKLPAEQRPELAILPLGTANDFARACQIPLDSLEALRLAVVGSASPIDVVRANDRYFVNMATAGFGAKVTAETPVELKNFLGGGAYSLVGVFKALNFVPYSARVTMPGFQSDDIGVVVAAICNGRQAGGGQVLAPGALIDDGLLEVLIVTAVLRADMATLLAELRDPSPSGQYVKYFQTPWLEGEADEPIPVNLDGEPYESKKIRFEIVPGAIDLVLPQFCPCLK